MMFSTGKYMCVWVCYCKWYVPWSKNVLYVCVCEKEKKDTHRTHSFYLLTHSDSCCWGKRRNASNTTPPNGASHSKQPQFNERETSHSSHLTQHVPQGLKETHTGLGVGGCSLRLPFLIFLILSITETVIIFFMYTYRGFTNMTTHAMSLWSNIQLCILWIIFFVSKTYTPDYQIIQQGVYNTCYPFRFLSMADASLAMDPL